MKELLLKYIMSNARECTTFSMKTGPNFDPWNLKSADFLFHFGNHFDITERLLSLTPQLMRRFFWSQLNHKSDLGILRKKDGALSKTRWQKLGIKTRKNSLFYIFSSTAFCAMLIWEYFSKIHSPNNVSYMGNFLSF